MKQIAQAHDLQFELYLSETAIQARVSDLGKALQQRYAQQHPIFLGILNGSFIFTADLVRAFGEECEIAFIKVASYEGIQSTGEIKTLIGLSNDLQDKHVIIVEDIVDTGNTMARLIPELQAQQPASIALATFLLKRDALLHPYLPLDYVGFEIPNKFVIGYGLDYNGSGRQLAAIYQLIG